MASAQSKLFWRLTVATVVVVSALASVVIVGYPKYAAIHAVRQLGGWVEVEPIGPDWLRRQLRFFWNDQSWLSDLTDPVVNVRLSDCGVTDSDLSVLTAFRRLKHLDIDSTSIGDDGLKHVGQLAGLESLCLSDTRISDAGMRELESLVNIKGLQIENTRISDVGLKSIECMSDLHYLRLGGTCVTDDGLISLLRCAKDLNLVWIDHTEISDVGLESLTRCSHIQQIDVHATRVSRKRFRELESAFPNIEFLPLSAPKNNWKSCNRCWRAMEMEQAASNLDR
jgi:Leucine Rich repeat